MHFGVLGDFLILKMMEQRICIKFCDKNKIKCSDVVKMLEKAIGESVMKKSVYEWYKRFEEGREDVEDDERVGRPGTSTIDENVEEIKKIVLDNRRIIIREVAEEVLHRLREAIRKNDQNCEKITRGNYITTMHQLTLHYLLVNFWQKTTL